jgi:ubiquinone/menaquinone biosynthesis C-methylase UbiE
MTGTLLADRYPVPCLLDGPLAADASATLAASRSLGAGAVAASLRAWSVAFLFDEMEKAFRSTDPPTPAILSALNRLAALFTTAASTGVTDVGDRAAASQEPALDVIAQVTGAHYGRLFREFSGPSFWQEPAELLQTRLARNSIPERRWRGRTVLDAGCGGGRYTVAWRLLGAAPVVGLDISDIGVADASARVRDAGLDDVRFETGDVLAMPFADDAFDVVFSNGVLHHTTDWRAGISELVRVLRRGGLGWLYLIENPGGLFWDVIEILRQIMREEDRETARTRLAVLGIPANRVFYMLDHVMVPVNIRLTMSEIEEALRGAGALDIQRLTRGADFDRIEAIDRGDPHAREKYGVGEHRYVFTK